MLPNIYKVLEFFFFMRNIEVSNVMTRAPIVIAPETNLLECAKKMVRKNVGSLPLVNKKKLVGFISQQDILWALIKKSKSDLGKIRAIDISPRKIATVKPETTISEAIEKMKKFKFERLPVIQNSELVGMLTVRDILNFKPELYPELNEFDKIREESRKLRSFKKANQIKREGICEECGQIDFLHRINGMLVCESCKNSLQ